MNRKEWRPVTKNNPCKVCEKDHGCMESTNGEVAVCIRISLGSFAEAKNGMGWMHRLIEKPINGNGHQRPLKPTRHPMEAPSGHPKQAEAPGRDWKALDLRLRGAMTPELLAKLAEATGVPATAWETLSPGWAAPAMLRELGASGKGWAEDPPAGAWSFAERDGEGRIVGISFRAVDGRKGCAAGGKRGLTVPANLHQAADPVLVVEGASDVAASVAMGLAAVGRPNNRGGAEDLAILLDGRKVLVVGERDGKPDGRWPGRDGAKAVAGQLVGRWREETCWTLLPLETKDVRAFLQAKIATGLNPADGTAMKAAGAELAAALVAAAKPGKVEKRAQSDVLEDLAREFFRFGMSLDGDLFAVPVEGPAVAIMFRGGRIGLRPMLAKQYRMRTGKTASASALANALGSLEGIAQEAEPEPLALRVGEHDGTIVLDLADVTGRAVVVTRDGWTVETVSPVLFRRTELSSPFLEPVQAEPRELLKLRELLNVDDESWPLVVGYLIAAVMPGIPHPVLLINGLQGTGKSTAARLVVGLVDPSAAPLRSEPRDAEQWAIAAAGSWMVCLDNVSHIPGWLSDAICKACTGDGLVRRKLYTDSGLAVLAFKRCVILTSIDPGALRGDLADRLAMMDLERIPDDRRRTEAELEAEYAATRPRLLGALLSALSRTLAALPGVTLATMPRMADFARVLAAVDAACPELTDGRALEIFAGQRERVAVEVVEGDAVAAAVVSLAEADGGRWAGTAAELLGKISPEKPARGWPASARALAGQLRRIVPALRAVGVEVAFGRQSGGGRSRIITIEKRGEQPSLSSPDAASGGENEAGEGRLRDGAGPLDVGNRANESGIFMAVEGVANGRDGRDDVSPGISESAVSRERGEL